MRRWASALWYGQPGRRSGRWCAGASVRAARGSSRRPQARGQVRQQGCGHAFTPRKPSNGPFKLVLARTLHSISSFANTGANTRDAERPGGCISFCIGGSLIFELISRLVLRSSPCQSDRATRHHSRRLAHLRPRPRYPGPLASCARSWSGRSPTRPSTSVCGGSSQQRC